MSNMNFLILLYIWRRKKYFSGLEKRRRKRSCWVRPIYQNRNKLGAENNLIAEMRLNDISHYNNFFRMGSALFEELLSLVGPHITKVDVKREPVNPATRLSITLRFLASGDSMTSLTYLFRVGKSTVSEIIAETTVAIWTVLNKKVLPIPNEGIWKKIAEDFNARWQFPNYIGAIDGKHVTIQAPPNSGSEYYNYKGSHSIVLMAVVDAHYRFTLVDIGAQGRQSDGGIFRASTIGKKMEQNLLNIPPPSAISTERPPVPYVFVGDEAFPLSENLMRPYSSKSGLNMQKNIFNYRLSRARQISEIAFGVLVSCWRIFSKPIIAKLETVDNIIKAAVCLHNYIIIHNKNAYISKEFLDHNFNSHLTQGTSRQKQLSYLLPIGRTSSNMHKQKASNIRDIFKDFFNEEGAVNWQSDKV